MASDSRLQEAKSRFTPAQPGQVREDEWRRWYVGAGEQDFVCMYETLAGDVRGELLTLPAWMFTKGKVGRPVGTWTGTLLAPLLEETP